MDPRLTTADVFITDQLATRPPRRPDYLREKNALRQLAGEMVEHPERVLPKFVELAMELTDCSSAGLSLLDPVTHPDTFEWRHLHGKLAPFEGAPTPRDDSPCGVTLDNQAVTLSAHPERVYQWIADEKIVVPEVLLVPLRVGADEPFGTLWVVSEEPGRLTSEDGRVCTELADFIAMALKMSETENQLREALAEQQLLAQEMSHRVKNVFALAESMIRLTAPRVDTPAALAESVVGRLHALAEAHSLIRRDGVGAELKVDLAELIRTIVRPYDFISRSERHFAITGPELALGAQVANGITLVIHELATNAAKYGSLTDPKGRVEVAWRRDGGHLVLDWRETGGPRLAGLPETSGFGSTLIKRTIEGQLGGSYDAEWASGGLAVRMRLPVPAV